MAGITPPPHDWVGKDGEGFYFDSIDNSAYILGKAKHSFRTRGFILMASPFKAYVRMSEEIQEPWVNIAWKYIWTAKDTWLGTEENLGAIGSCTTSRWIPSRNMT